MWHLLDEDALALLALGHGAVDGAVAHLLDDGGVAEAGHSARHRLEGGEEEILAVVVVGVAVYLHVVAVALDVNLYLLVAVVDVDLYVLLVHSLLVFRNYSIVH